MTRFVLYDPIKKGYMKEVCGTTRQDPYDAKHYKTLRHAFNGADLMNVNRNIPPGHTGPSKYYSNLPNVEVHEFDRYWKQVNIHSRYPQSYIHL